MRLERLLTFICIKSMRLKNNCMLRPVHVLYLPDISAFILMAIAIEETFAQQ